MPGIPGIPGMAAMSPVATFEARLQPGGGNAVAAGLVNGVAVAQFCGTDNAPTSVARPMPPDTAEPPRDGKLGDSNDDSPGRPDPPPRGGKKPPTAPAPNFSELMSAIALVMAGLIKAGFAYPPEMTPFPRPELRNVPAAEFVCPSNRFSNPDSPVVAVFVPGANGLIPPSPRSEPSPDPEDEGDASVWSVLGTLVTSCDNVVCALVPADVPAARVSAAAWLDSPAELVFCVGEANGVTFEAAADCPA